MGEIKSVPVKPAISYDDFEKIDIQVGIIELVEDVPKPDKLVKLTVDFGGHKRTVLTGNLIKKVISCRAWAMPGTGLSENR